MARYQNLDKISELVGNFHFDPQLSSYKDNLIQTAGIDKFLTFNDQFFLVFDISTDKIIYISESMTDMMGWSREEASLQYIYNQIVKEDRNQVLEATEYALGVCMANPGIRAFENTFEVDFRMRKKDGSVVSMMRKSCIYKKDKKGFPVLFLSIYTDISSFKKDDSIVIAVEGPDKYLFNFVKKDSNKHKNGMFTRQEIGILKKLAEGKCCKVIAGEMNLRLSTVNSYCRNMLRKTHKNKINGVLALAVKNGCLI
jgi:DNA-binding CsgD family transcriptional regulator